MRSISSTASLTVISGVTIIGSGVIAALTLIESRFRVPLRSLALISGREHPGGPSAKRDRCRDNATPCQVLLRFLTRRPSLFTIPKACSPEHVSENAEAGDLQLPKDEIALIDLAFPLTQRYRGLPTL